MLHIKRTMVRMSIDLLGVSGVNDEHYKYMDPLGISSHFRKIPNYF